MSNREAMFVRNFITFDADFPDDSQWDEFGNSLVPGGQNIAEAIRTSLGSRAGLSCSDSVVQHSFYGWAFDVVTDKGAVSCLLQGGDGWLLLLEQKRTLLSRLLGSTNTSAVEQVQKNLSETLNHDKRFSNVLWYTRADYAANRKDRARPIP